MYWIKVHQTALRFSKEKRKQRQMGCLLTVVALLATYLYGWNHDSRNLFLTLSSLPILFALTIPSILRSILYIWMLLGQVIGDFIGTLIISLIYFLLITPVSLFIKKKNTSGWITKKSSNIDLEKMY